MGSIAEKLVRGSLLRVAEFAANSIVGLVLMPFIVHSLGDRMYGLWIFVGTFLGYYGLMDFGLNSAVQRYISRAVGLKDDGEANAVVSTALLIFSAIGLLALVISAVVAVIVPHLVADIREVTTFRQVIFILGANFALGFPLRVYSGYLSATVRYDLSTGVDLLKLAVRTALIIFLLKRGHGILALSLVTFAVDIGGYLARCVIVRKLYPSVAFSLRLVDRSRVRQLFSYSIFTFIAQVAEQLRFNVQNLVITFSLSLSLVTMYSIASRLIQYFVSFNVAALGMLSPVFSQYEAAGQTGKMVDRFLFMTRISGYLSVFIGGVMVIFGNAFISRWMGSDYRAAYPLLVVLVVPIVIALMQSPSIQLLYGISKHRFFALSNAAEGAANLLLSVLLVRQYGLMGIAVASGIPMLVIKLFVQPVYTCRSIGVSLRTYYLGTLAPVFFRSLALLAAAWWACRPLISPDYLRLLLLISGTAVVFGTGVFMTGFTSKERGYFLRAVCRRLPLPVFRAAAEDRT